MSENRHWVLPRYSEEQLADAELFATGFRWLVERALDVLKHTPLHDNSPEPKIPRLTSLLDQVNRWTLHDAAEIVRGLKQRDPEFVAACIGEARECRLQLATAIAGTPQMEAE